MPNWNSAEPQRFCALDAEESTGRNLRMQGTDQNLKKTLHWGTRVGRVLSRIGGEREEGTNIGN